MINDNKYFLKKYLYLMIAGGISIGSTFSSGKISLKSARDDVYNYYNYDTTYYNSLLSDKYYTLPELERYIPQGICQIDDYIYISAYNEFKQKSILYEIDCDNRSRVIKLDTNAHVGGICFDEKNNYLWICDKKACISAYYLDNIKEYDEVEASIEKIDIGSDLLINYLGIPAVAYITIYNDRLYAGNFSTNENGILLSYDISSGEIDFSSKKIYQTPNKVQGVCFYEKDDKTYIIFSESFGKETASNLEVCEFDESISDYRNKNSIKCMTPRMMEQIYINGNELLLVYESNAKKYQSKKDNIDKICILNLDEFLSKKNTRGL